MFETLIEMLHTLETVGDVSMRVNVEGTLCLTFDDFNGFDEHWSETMREYAIPELVDEVFDLLNSCPCVGDYYTIYTVEGHEVEVGYTSMDI